MCENENGLFSAQDEITVMNEKEMYASPGSDVNLKCSIPKGHGIYITQTQWTKIDGDPPRRIAVYNPNHGTQYFDFSEAAYGHSVRVTFTNLQQCQSDLNWTSKGSDSQAKYSKCNEWILHLRNVSLELTGLYECSFTTFPTGTRSSEIHLIIQTEGKLLLFNERETESKPISFTVILSWCAFSL